MPRVAKFILSVVVGNPLVVLVLGGDVLPEPDGEILMVLEVPEGGISGAIIGVPVLILRDGHRVHVMNAVDALRRANVDAVKVPEAAMFENPRNHVALELSVGERAADAVYTNGTEESSILLMEEVIEEEVKEVLVLRSHDPEHRDTRVGLGLSMVIHEVPHAALNR